MFNDHREAVKYENKAIRRNVRCITKEALRYYEKEGLIKPERDENNYRNYLQSDIDVLKLILKLEMVF